MKIISEPRRYGKSQKLVDILLEQKDAIMVVPTLSHKEHLIWDAINRCYDNSACELCAEMESDLKKRILTLSEGRDKLRGKLFSFRGELLIDNLDDTIHRIFGYPVYAATITEE